MEAADSLERYLRTAPILATAGPVTGGGGHPGKHWLLLAGGVQVIAKPAIERPETTQMVRCEAAAWLVAKALGFEGLVAATVVREIPGPDDDDREYRTMRGAGHLFFIEAAEETMTALSRFIHN